MCENFERISYSLSLDVMRSSMCNVEELCCITHVVLKNIGKINVVYEEFVITETHDAYSFIFRNIIQNVNVWFNKKE